MKTLAYSLLLAGTALPAFATELTIWDWKSGDPAAAAYYAKGQRGVRGRPSRRHHQLCHAAE